LVEACEGKITVEQAKQIIADYNAGYAGLTSWKRKALGKARKKGYVETLGGRRRRLTDLNVPTDTKEGWAARSKAERQAINAIIQGTAAEICKDAMVDLDKALAGTDARMLLQVHDELIVSTPTEQLTLWEPVVEQSMGDGRIIMGVPLNVTAHHAGSWNDAKG
jgi:DNA polymerase-1